jgi:phytoene dehydrogenase-like protein
MERLAHSPGGAGAVTEALVSELQSLGAEIVPSHPVHDLKGLPESRTLFFDLTHRQILSIARSRIPVMQQARLSRYRYGPGVFKLDWALDGPIPWKANGCSDAATVHLGGSFEEIALSEHRVGQGMHPERPFVICAQPSLFDASRAPADRHVAWAYCHVPGGSEVDMTERIEGQIERFAPVQETDTLPADPLAGQARAPERKSRRR